MDRDKHRNRQKQEHTRTGKENARDKQIHIQEKDTKTEKERSVKDMQ